MIRKILLSTAIAIIASSAFAATSPTDKIVEKAAEQKPSKEEILKIKPDEIVLGDKDAKVTIIEYASMSCSHCAHFKNDIYPKLKEQYIDTGKIKFVFRDFPLDEPGLKAAMIGRCVSVDKFDKFNQAIFSTQENWAPKKNYLEILSNIAKLGGMKGDEFDACIANKDIENKIMESRLNASTVLQVNSTPTFFINGEEYKGANGIEFFSKIIDPLLEGAPKVNSKENTTPVKE